MPVQTKDQGLARLREARAELRRFGVKRCGVFGSFVRNATGDQSDVDILVEFEPDQKTFDHFMHLAFFLEEKYHSSPVGSCGTRRMWMLPLPARRSHPGCARHRWSDPSVRR
jgi:predicted nucleotidyltransferase